MNEETLSSFQYKVSITNIDGEDLSDERQEILNYTIQVVQDCLNELFSEITWKPRLIMEATIDE